MFQQEAASHKALKKASLAVVTGGSGGLGFATACGLLKAGHSVILAVRSSEKGAAACEALRAQVPGCVVEALSLDLASLRSVRAFAHKMMERGTAIDILICNAGVMAPLQRQETEDGAELQFGVNHLGHFALVHALKPLLCAAEQGGVVVSVASLAAWRGRIRFDDLRATARYSPFSVYATSKLANLMFAFEFARRVRESGDNIHVRAAHPGWARTQIVNNGPGKGLAAFLRIPGELGQKLVFRLCGQSAEQGAAPLLYAALSPEAVDGGYYGPGAPGERRGSPALAAIPPQARDEKVARHLWEVSERLTGICG